MIRRSVVGALTALLLLPLLSAPAMADTPSRRSVVADPMAAYQARVLVLTNAERSRRSLRPLKASTCADRYADRWASRIAAAGALSHQSMPAMLRACAARGVGENVAYGNVTPEQLVTMWMRSPGHRANILNASFTHIGVGAVRTSAGRVYGVQDFLRL